MVSLKGALFTVGAISLKTRYKRWVNFSKILESVVLTYLACWTEACWSSEVPSEWLQGYWIRIVSWLVCMFCAYFITLPFHATSTPIFFIQPIQKPTQIKSALVDKISCEYAYPTESASDRIFSVVDPGNIFLNCWNIKKTGGRKKKLKREKEKN